MPSRTRAGHAKPDSTRIRAGVHERGLPLLFEHGEANLDQAAHENLVRAPVHREPQCAL